MGAPKRQRTADYFKRRGQIEISRLVAESVKKMEEKQVKQKKSEELKSSEEKQDEVRDTIK